MVNKTAQRMRDQQQKQYQNSSDAKVGETIIEKKPLHTNKDKKVGEYIDYEEVD